MKIIHKSLVLAMAAAVMAGSAWANNIQVSSVTQNGMVPGSHLLVRFNLQWENSWRCDIAGAGQSAPYNWDAAWVFVKYKVAPGDWHHATLNATGHSAPSGSTIATPSDGKGVFIYRDANGTGTFTANGAWLRWNYAADGVGDTDTAEVMVCAVEMVYVPQGAFNVGSGGTGWSEFYAGGGGKNPFNITSEEAITVGTAAGQLYYNSSDNGGDRGGPIPAAFPKGYAAFYGMKTEISQGQYCDFLNTLTGPQASARYSNENGNYRHGITLSGSVYTSANWYVACNFLAWSDVAAYADWAALRPLTELEFEKACRGTETPVTNEYAWGKANITAATGISNAGGTNEVASNSGANCVYGNPGGVQGPMRVGCLAKSAATREQAGAGYYGMLELSGNLYERPVTVGNAAGRAFSGLHGNGSLTTDGNAGVSNWPAINSSGAGFRGGCWYHPADFARASDRTSAALADGTRNRTYGGRCGRSAP
ncbi:MAG TPA: hypothetical protein P5567_14725 [Kiritimatiellia bacterium]|nr:hypothetical protein [Kiritimatiellia bacterium]HSA19397.1 hypothetical protein [Kiritimatiellia bacterium]